MLLWDVETTPPNAANSSPRSKLYITKRVYWRKFEIDSTFSFPSVSVRILKASGDWSFTLTIVRNFIQ